MGRHRGGGGVGKKSFCRPRNVTKHPKETRRGNPPTVTPLICYRTADWLTWSGGTAPRTYAKTSLSRLPKRIDSPSRESRESLSTWETPLRVLSAKNCAADTRYRHAGAGQYSHAEWQPLPLLFFVSSEDRLIRKMPAGHEDQGLLSIAQIRKGKRSERSSLIPSGTGRTGVAGEGVTDANVLAPPFA